MIAEDRSRFLDLCVVSMWWLFGVWRSCGLEAMRQDDVMMSVGYFTDIFSRLSQYHFVNKNSSYD
jgi:hypothetical protein